MHHRRSWVPTLKIFMLRLPLADRLHDTRKDMPEQIGIAMWLGIYFMFHPTVFSALVMNLPTAVFVEGINKLLVSFNCVKRADPCKTLHSPVSDNSSHIGHWT
jgi:hypothetical protein